MRLFHYTCSHGRRGIGARGFIVPSPQFWSDSVKLAWLTDMKQPDREGLGLTSSILSCDRMQFRYVTTDHAEPWIEWARRNSVPLSVRALLEPDRDPSRWFVSERPMWAALDRAYSEATA